MKINKLYFRLSKYGWFILMSSNIIMAQQTMSDVPYSFNGQLDMADQIIELAPLDHDALLEEDQYAEPNTPYRFGFTHEVNYNPENSGIWMETPNGGMLWKSSFKSEGAYALSFEIDDFHIPHGGELFIYTP
ncbi:uncharacterized protein METZ01_LOCUS472687, partial [marine metagenome]